MQAKTPARLLKVVGVSCLLMAVAGIYYNYTYLSVDYSGAVDALYSREELQIKPGTLSNFFPVFYILSGICITFYVLLLLTGIQLIRLKVAWVFVLLAIIVLEMIYFFMLSGMSGSSEYGYTVAAVSGVSSGGLVFQAISFFPIWAPIAAFWARSKILQGDGTKEL